MLRRNTGYVGDFQQATIDLRPPSVLYLSGTGLLLSFSQQPYGRWFKSQAVRTTFRRGSAPIKDWRLHNALVAVKLVPNWCGEWLVAQVKWTKLFRSGTSSTWASRPRDSPARSSASRCAYARYKHVDGGYKLPIDRKIEVTASFDVREDVVRYELVG